MVCKERKNKSGSLTVIKFLLDFFVFILLCLCSKRGISFGRGSCLGQAASGSAPFHSVLLVLYSFEQYLYDAATEILISLIYLCVAEYKIVRYYDDVHNNEYSCLIQSLKSVDEPDRL